MTKRPVWQVVHELTGRRMAMPVNFLDMRMMGSEFRIPPDQARLLVLYDRFVLTVAEDDLARCQVMAPEYQQIDIVNPYDELAITIPGSLRGLDRTTDLLYYIQLPVTTEDARWPGVEIYGFPKYVAAIDFEESESDVACTLALAGQEILTLRVTKGAAQDDERQVENLTFLDDVPLLTTFRCRGRRHASAGPGGAILHLGEHRNARELRSAQLELSSVAHFYCPTMSATLSTPNKPESAGG
ncbi:acetoacetate decarboxylase family protein [Chloroflexota bacterium]